uniref:Transmembrane protein 59 like n=1 Tax=Strix occidentalis caurina TaxID=311401 RepID=A0A8D0EJS1_STROC
MQTHAGTPRIGSVPPPSILPSVFPAPPVHAPPPCTPTLVQPPPPASPSRGPAGAKRPDRDGGPLGASFALSSSSSPQDAVLNACYRGCRLFSICHFVDASAELNTTRAQCEAACAEAYSNAEEQFGCVTGCRKQLPEVESRKEKLKAPSFSMFDLVSTFCNDIVSSAQSFISSTWTFYLQADDGKVVVFQVGVSRVPSLGPGGGAWRCRIHRSRCSPPASNSHPVPCHKLVLFLWRGGVGCYRRSGLPRWILAACLFLSIMVMLWLSCASLVTAPEQHVKTQVRGERFSAQPGGGYWGGPQHPGSPHHSWGSFAGLSHGHTVFVVPGHHAGLTGVSRLCAMSPASPGVPSLGTRGSCPLLWGCTIPSASLPASEHQRGQGIPGGPGWPRHLPPATRHRCHPVPHAWWRGRRAAAPQSRPGQDCPVALPPPPVTSMPPPHHRPHGIIPHPAPLPIPGSWRGISGSGLGGTGGTIWLSPALIPRDGRCGGGSWEPGSGFASSVDVLFAGILVSSA